MLLLRVEQTSEIVTKNPGLAAGVCWPLGTSAGEPLDTPGVVERKARAKTRLMGGE